MMGWKELMPPLPLLPLDCFNWLFDGLSTSLMGIKRRSGAGGSGAARPGSLWLAQGHLSIPSGGTQCGPRALMDTE